MRLWRDSWAQALAATIIIRSALPSIFWQRVFVGAALSVASVGIEDEDGAVFAGDLDRLGGVWALVEQVAVWLRIVVGNPFADGLPRRLDGLEGLDVEGRVRWWRDVDDALMSLPLHPSGCLRQSMSAPLPFPKSVQAEEEFDFPGAEESVHDFHGAFATRALEWIGVPDSEDEVTPERAHRAGGDFGWRRDDGRLGCARLFAGGFYFGAVRARHAAAFIRVETEVADRLLPSWWDVIDGGGEEVGGFEDFEISLRAPTAPGAVDDGLRFRVPSVRADWIPWAPLAMRLVPCLRRICRSK